MNDEVRVMRGRVRDGGRDDMRRRNLIWEKTRCLKRKWRGVRAHNLVPNLDTVQRSF